MEYVRLNQNSDYGRIVVNVLDKVFIGKDGGDIYLCGNIEGRILRIHPTDIATISSYEEFSNQRLKQDQISFVVTQNKPVIWLSGNASNLYRDYLISWDESLGAFAVWGEFDAGIEVKGHIADHQVKYLLSINAIKEK